MQIDAGPRGQHSPGGEESRITWNDDAFDAELARRVRPHAMGRRRRSPPSSDRADHVRAVW